MSKKQKIDAIGVFYGVGVGPGDEELLTLKALRALKECRVIAVPDSGRDGDGLAEGVVKKALGKSSGKKEFLRLKMPMTKDATALDEARRIAAGQIAGHLKSGVDAAFVTLGDPLFFSTFASLIPYVKDACPEAEIIAVPGVTSFSAASAALLTPLCEASERVAIVPAAYGVDDLKNLLEGFDAVVLMKVNRALDEVLDFLKELGPKVEAAFVSKASWPDEEVVRDVKKLRGRKADYFSMMIIRKNKPPLKKGGKGGF